MEVPRNSDVRRAFTHTTVLADQQAPGYNAKVALSSAALAIIGGVLLSTFSLPTVNDAKWWQFATIVLLFTLTLFSNIHLRVGRAELTVSYSDIPLTMCVLMVNPWLAVAARLLGLVVALAARKRDIRRFSFNSGLFIFDTAVAYSLVRLFDGGFFTAASLGATVLGIIAGGLVTAQVAMSYFAWLQGTTDWVVTSSLMRVNVITAAVGALVGSSSAFVMTQSQYAVPAILALFFATLFVASRSRRHHKRMSSLARFADKANSASSYSDDLPELLLKEACSAVGGHDAAILVGEEHRGAAPVIRTSPWFGVGRYIETAPGLPPGKCVVDIPLTVWNDTPARLVVSRRTAELGVFTREHMSFLAPLVNHAMSCWTMATLATQHQERSHRDEHTGLLNEPGFRAGDPARLAPGRLAAFQVEEYSGTVAAFGVDVARELIQHVAERLRGEAASLPGATAVRLSEEVLGIWLPQEHAEELHQLSRHLRKTYELGDLSLDVDMRVGFADSYRPGPVSEVIDKALSALAHACALGTTEPFEYNTRDDWTYMRRATLAADLPAAIRSGTLCARLSPYVSAASETARHVLVEPEWAHHEFGMVKVAEFMPFAEQSQMTGDVVWWVLKESADAYALWADESPDLGVAVSVTRQEISSKAFAEQVVAWLRTVALPASCLVIKVPESELSGALDDVHEAMSVLRAAGVDITLKNVGAGFSSLSVFRELPLTGVSFDASLTRDVAKDLDRQSMLKNMVALVHDLGLAVSASGVVSPRAVDFLAACGCDVVSGPVVGKSMTKPQARAWATGVKGI